jgi:hypothetical protein
VTERVARDGLAIEVERGRKALGRVAWDVAAMAYLTALLGGYFLSMTPPLPASEVEAARALGRRRFNVLVDQIANRFGTDGRLTGEIVEADHGWAATTFDDQIETAHAPADGLAGTLAAVGAEARVTKTEEKDEE